MTPIDFIASLPHGEAKAAALTVYNLMTPVWIEINDDPATLPERGQTVILRMNADSGGGEEFGLRDGRFPEEWSWFHCKRAYWNVFCQSIRPVSLDTGKTPTHWRPVS
jgi:hypothetical protein